MTTLDDVRAALRELSADIPQGFVLGKEIPEASGRGFIQEFTWMGKVEHVSLSGDEIKYKGATPDALRRICAARIGAAAERLMAPEPDA